MLQIASRPRWWALRLMLAGVLCALCASGGRAATPQVQYLPWAPDSLAPLLSWSTTEDPSSVSLLHRLNPSQYVDTYLSAVRVQESDPMWSAMQFEELDFMHSTDPASLSYASGSGNAVLHWQADGRPAYGLRLGGYRVYLGQGQTSHFVAQVAPTVTSYTLSGLTNRALYWVKITSVLNNAETSYSTWSPVTPGNTGLQLDSQSYSIAGTVAPLSTITLHVNVHALGALPSSLTLQTLVQPVVVPNPTVPQAFTMLPIGGGWFSGSARLTLPAGWYGGVAYRVQNSSASVSLPATRNTYFATTINNRLHFSKYAHNWTMDPGSASWRYRLKVKILSVIGSVGFNGVLLDDVVAMLQQDRPEAFPAAYSDSSYLTNVAGLTASLRATLPRSLQICSNGFANPVLAHAVAPYIERGMFETFAYDSLTPWPNGFAPLSYWRTLLDNVLTMSRTYGKTLRINALGMENMTAGRNFAYASYLLVHGSNTTYAFDDSVYVGASGNFFPETTISLGNSLQDFTAIAQAYVVSDGAYERQFTSGKVIVNPSDSVATPTINLGGTHKLVGLVGGSLQHGGIVTLIPVSAIRLQPKQAAIILY